jgi:site-specific DNA recombinase
MTPTAALIYVRISQDRAGAGLGVARQEADCRDLAERLGWTVTDVIVDNDVSASKERKRPGYTDLMGRLSRGEVQGLIAWHTDRLHRRPVELEQFIDVLETSKVMVQTVRAGPLDLSTSSGRMVARMLGAAARYEVDRISERQKAKRLQKVAAGEYVGGRRPFGFEADGVTIRESEAAAVAKATAQVVGGASVRSVAAGMTLTTPGGRPFDGVELRRVLIRPRNAGLTIHNGEPAGPGKWPAIVDPELWAACRAILTDPSRVTNLGAKRRFLGSGLFLCGVCGGTVTAKANNRKPVYGCHVGRRADLVDEMVTETVLARLRRPDAAGLTAPTTVDTSGLYTAAQGLRGRLAELARMFADGTISGAQLTAGSSLLHARLEDVERQIGHTSTGLAAFAGRDPDVVWAGLDVERRRQVVKALVTVTLHPGGRGRPAGWRPGDRYFDRSTVRIVPAETIS